MITSPPNLPEPGKLHPGPDRNNPTHNTHNTNKSNGTFNNINGTQNNFATTNYIFGQHLPQAILIAADAVSSGTSQGREIIHATTEVCGCKKGERTHSNIRSTRLCNMDHLAESNIVIAVMGPRAVGKTTFIDHACGRARRTGITSVGHGSKPAGLDIELTRVIYNDQSVVLADIPSFDNEDIPDTKILQMIANWLQEICRRKVKLAGIIYLHRIADGQLSELSRAPNSQIENLLLMKSVKLSSKSLEVSTQICGTEAAENVVLATTMWDRVEQRVGERREVELTNSSWRSLLKNGAKVAQFHGTPESAQRIIDLLTGLEKRKMLLLQEELVDRGKKLGMTCAGKALCRALQKECDEYRQKLQELSVKIKTLTMYHRREDLIRQSDELVARLRFTSSQVVQLKVSFGRRALELLSPRKTNNGPI